MFPESKVTEIYCMADDFCKEFTLQQEKYMIKDMKTMHRNKPNLMVPQSSMVPTICFTPASVILALVRILIIIRYRHTTSNLERNTYIISSLRKCRP